MNYVLQQLTSKKTVLYVSAVAALVADLFASLMLMAYGMPLESFIIPLVLTVADAVFLLISVFTNFKFSYSSKYIGIYAAIFSLGSILYLLSNTEILSETVTYTWLAIGLWFAVHLASVLATALGAARAGASDSGFARASVISVAVSLLVTVLWGAVTLSSGIYGQGKAEQARPVTFTYDSAHGYYVASSAGSGRGGTVTVPATFNGKPVGAIDCFLFAEGGVDRVVILTETAPELRDALYISGVSEELEITVPKAIMTDFVNSFMAVRTDQSLSLARRISPHDLENDEIFVSFTYSTETLENIDEYMPVWIGKRGDEFDLSFASGISYVARRDRNDEQLLAQLYEQNAYGGAILRPITVSGEALVGKRLDKSISGVEIAFDKIYNVRFGQDNDELYELDAEYTGADSGRYVLADTANGIIASAPVRAGFELSYRSGGSIITDLGAHLAGAASQQIVIAPVWQLMPPKITSAASDAPGGSVVYGNAITLTGEATAPADGISLRYTWMRGVEQIFSGSLYETASAGIDFGGEYTLVCEAYSDTLTSLTSSAEATVSVSVEKRPLPISFNELAGGGYTRIYDGTSAELDITYDSAEVLAGDTITYELSIPSVRDAGTYDVTVSLTDDAALKYKLDAAQTLAQYTVTPREVSLDWGSELQFVYNATVTVPDCSIIGGIVGGDEVKVSIDAGNSVNAGKYTAYAALDNPNYTVKAAEKSIEFEITKAPLTVVWDTASLTVTYNAKTTNKPTVSTLSGAVGGESPVASVTVTAPGRDVGSYTAVAALTGESVNRNYYIAQAAETSFSIVAKEITVSWKNTVLTYNGSAGRLPTPVFSGVEPQDSAMESVESDTDAKNVGSYFATVTVGNSNYKLTGTGSTGFEIKPATVTLIWGTSTLVYDGTEQVPTVTVGSGVCGTDSFTLSVSGHAKDASLAVHTASVQLVPSGSTLSGNYTVSNPTCAFTVEPKPITLAWEGLTVTYNGENQKPTVTPIGVIEGDELHFTVGEAMDAGEHTVTASISDTNYKLADGAVSKQTFTIRKKTVTVTWTETTFVYDSGSHMPTPAVSGGVIDGDTVTVTATGTPGRDVGKYTATAVSGNANYTVGTGVTCEYTISAKEITVSFVDLIHVYNGKLQRPEIQVVGVIGGEDAEITVNGGTDAGEYSVTVSVGSKNYKLSTASETSATLKIEKAPVTAAFGETTLVYSGAAQAPTVSVTEGNVTGESITFTVAGAEKNVGTYTAVATLEHKNYYLPAAVSTSYEITARPLTLAWSALTLTYNALPQSATASAVGVLSGDTVNVTVRGQGTVPGSYDLFATVDNSNYSLDEQSARARLDIVCAPITIGFDMLTFIYNGRAYAPAPYVISGLIGTDTVELFASGEGTDVGTYTVTVTLDDERYVLAGETSAEFTVTPAAASVAWNAEGELSATFTTVGGDTVELDVKYYSVENGVRTELAAAPTEPGTYVAVADSSAYINYTLTGTEYELVIEDDNSGEEDKADEMQ